MFQKVKQRKPPKRIQAIGELVPIVAVQSSWVIHFRDHDQARDPQRAELLLHRDAIIALTTKPELLKALGAKAKELQRRRNRLRIYESADRVVVFRVEPSEVLEIAELVAAIEGRQLMFSKSTAEQKTKA